MKIKPEVIFEDDDLLVANKPSGITTIPDRFGKYVSLQGLLEKQYGKLFVVHRIDRDTSGIVCFAKNEAVHRHLSMQFQHHTVQKFYKAFVQGKMPFATGDIDGPIAEHPGKPGAMMVSKQGKEALTIFEVEEEFKHVSLLNVEIKTGRTHQIRVHMASVGHPLLVDEIYAGTSAFYFSTIKGKKYKPTAEEERPTIARLTLHAYQLALMHPTKNEPITVSAPFPKDLETLLKLLRKYDV